MLMECQISDPALTKGHNKSHSSYGAAGSIPKGSDHPADDESSSKKRKRDEPDASDPKLREFLQVMKRGRESAMEDMSNTNLGGDLPAVPAAAVPEEESDDEYEQIPASRGKQRRIDPPQKDQASDSPPAQLMEIDTPSASQVPASDETAEPSGAKQANLEQPGLGASDDDWLRSRTNRLLDLVDPDDLERIPVQATTTNAPETKGGDVDNTVLPSPPSRVDVAVGQAAPEKEAGESTSDDPLEAIRRTSRLFVRNLSYTTTENDLRESFEKFGTLEEVRDIFVGDFSCNRKGDVMNLR